MMRPVRFTRSPSLIVWNSPKSTAPTLSSSRFKRQAANVVRKLEQLAGHDLFEAVNLGDAVADLDDRADFHHRHAGSKFSICLRMISLISSALIGSIVFLYT